MTSKFEPHKDALSAVLFELIEDGYDVDRLLERVHVGIMGNKEYVTAQAQFKPSIIEALEVIVQEAKRYKSR
jgi:hypothetical protein